MKKGKTKAQGYKSDTIKITKLENVNRNFKILKALNGNVSYLSQVKY